MDKDIERELQKQVFQQFLGDNGKILIVEPSSLVRSTIASTMISLGAKTPAIHLANDLPSARETLEALLQRDPHCLRIILTEYDLGQGRLGPDLFQGLDQSLRMVLVSKPSDWVMSHAAQSGADAIFPKPLVLETFREKVLALAAERFVPSGYVEWVERGRALISEGKLKDAIEAFVSARKTLPLRSQVASFLPRNEEWGLLQNKIQYQCLSDLFDYFMRENRLADAYRVVKKMAPYSPVDPRRMTEIFRLAIVTGHFEDIESFYHYFKGLETKDEGSVKAICAALVVTGKHYARKGELPEASRHFGHAVMTAVGRPDLLKSVLLSMVESGLVSQAEKGLRWFKEKSQIGPDYMTVDYMIMDKVADAVSVIQRGWKLLDQQIHDPIVYEILIKRLVERGKRDPAENLAYDAIRRWPGERERFSRILSPGA